MALGYIYKGRYMPADEYYAAKARDYEARSHLSAPRIIADGIEITSMTDGKVYTSKAALRRAYREQGFIEVGNEWEKNPPQPPKPKVDRKGIRESVGKALSRVGISV